jgi:hypothetical protein
MLRELRKIVGHCNGIRCYMAMLVRAIIVHALDRLSRKLAHQLWLNEGCESAGMALHIAAVPDSTKTPET